MDSNVKLDLAEDREETELKDIKGYLAIVGSLMYMALATQPDISFAVTALCRYNSRPFTSHLTAAKRVLRYPKSTADFGLHFSSSGSNDQLTGFTDSDWANVSANRTSQGGHIFLRSNGAVSWQSRTQDFIAMSTLEAEYIACSESSREAQLLLQLHRDIHAKDASLLPINCDNLGADSHITTKVIKARTKHSDMSYQNSRDLHARKIVDYFYVHTNENVADILTNALTKDKHEQFTKTMGLWQFMEGFKVVSLFFWASGFPCLSGDGHPQATVVLFPCSLSQCFKEATMGITLFVCLFVCFISSYLFSCSMVYSKRGSIA